MTRRPDIAGILRRRPWIAVVGVGLPAVALVVFLIQGLYTSRQAQRATFVRDELAHTSALSVSLDHFLSGLQSDLTATADRREVSAYFENAALGLSLEYGLRISLLDLETEFDQRLTRKLPGGQPLFSRLVLLDATGDVVLDSRDPRRDPGAPFTTEWTPPPPGNDATPASDTDYLPAEDYLLLASECRVLDRHEGWLLAFVPTATLRAQVLGEASAEPNLLWLTWEEHILGGEDLPSPGQLPDRLPMPGQTAVTGDREHLLSCVRADHYPLTVTRASAIDGAIADSPHLFLWGLVALAGMSMALSGLVWMGQLRAQALSARLATEAGHLRDLAARQRELEAEIERRLQVEHDLEQARDDAEAASRAKSAFLANMSHEIRTPLNGVLGMTELVLDTSLDDMQREQLEVAFESGRSLLTVINDILDVSAIEAGAMRLNPHEFAPADELEKIRRSLLVGIQARGLHLAWDVDTTLAPMMLGDPARIRQVLVNILGNAMKFTEKGTIGLSVRVAASDASRQFLEFTVRDTGIGIALDKQDMIFEAFRQADDSHTRRYGGTGLGLHICRRLVAMMGGQLTLESRVGEGSCFRFAVELPVVQAAAAITAASPAPPVATTPRAAPRRLLVAEDNVVNQKLVVTLLRKWGHEVTLTADGVEALAALYSNTFDGALLDLQMPNLDGIEVARQWREHERATGRPRLPLVAVTARVLPEDAALCAEVGFDAHLPKPLNSRLLAETIEQTMPPAAVLQP